MMKKWLSFIMIENVFIFRQSFLGVKKFLIKNNGCFCFELVTRTAALLFHDVELLKNAEQRKLKTTT